MQSVCLQFTDEILDANRDDWNRLFEDSSIVVDNSMLTAMRTDLGNPPLGPRLFQMLQNAPYKNYD